MKFYTVGQIGKRYKVPLREVYDWRLKVGQSFGYRGRGGGGIRLKSDPYGRCVCPQWIVDLFPDVPKPDEKTFTLMTFNGVARFFVRRGDVLKMKSDIAVNAEPELFPDQFKDIKVAKPKIQKIKKGMNKYLIHVRGPRYKNDPENKDARQLRMCYWRSLELVDKHQLKSIAIPCISVDTHEYRRDMAALIAISAVTEYISSTEINSRIKEVIFTTKSRTDEDIYKTQLHLE